MAKTHIGSQLPLSKYCIPIDYANTVQLNHFDITAKDISGKVPVGAYVDESCVVYYDFTNYSGSTLYDKSNAGNYGIISGPTVIVGRNGRAFSFDGSNDYVMSNVVNTTIRGVSMWLKVDAIPTDSRIVFIHPPSKTALGFYTGNSFILSCNGSTQRRCDLTGFVVGQWNHIVINYDATGIPTVYINRVQPTYLSTTSWSGSEPMLYIGRRGSGNWCAMQMSKFIMYNRNLTDAEIYDHYNESIYRLVDGKFGGAVSINELTTNMITAIGSTGWNINQNVDYGYISHEIIDTKFGVKGISKTINSADYRACLNTMAWTGYTVTDVDPNAYYTMSIYARSTTPGGSTRLRLNIEGKALDGTTRVDRAVSFYLTNTDWQRFSVTFRPIDVGMYSFTSSFKVYTESSDSTTRTIEIAAPQAEKKPFATAFTVGQHIAGRLMYANPLKDITTGTINFWAKYPKYSTSGLSGFTNNWISFTSSTLIGINSSYQLQGFGNANATTYEDAWHMYTIVKNGDAVTTYIDGEQAGSYTDANFGSGDYMAIGAGIDWSNTSNIIIDELRIDKVVRTEEEITAWYLCDAPFFPKGLTHVAL